MTDTITLKRETVQQALLDEIDLVIAVLRGYPVSAARSDAIRASYALRAALQPAEPQAQAGEPDELETLLRSVKFSTHKNMALHIAINKAADALQSHREAMAETKNAYFQLSCDIAELKTAIAKKDAALKVQSDALEKIKNKAVSLADAQVIALDAITQAQEQLK